MTFSPLKLNLFLFFKLPAAFISGVRVKVMNKTMCLVTVKHRWINQNPFRSMYFAVQAMAAELSTGVLVMYGVEKSKQKIAMLVINQKATFFKKAVGLISFTSQDGDLVAEAVREAIITGEGQTFWMKSVGIDQKGDQVSEMFFEWSIKVKK